MAGALDPIKKGYNFLFEKKKLPTGVVGSIFLFLLLVVVFSYSTSSLEDQILSLSEIQTKLGGGGGGGGGDEVPFPPEKYAVAAPETITIQGHSNENTDSEEVTAIPQNNLINITFTLTWTDEADVAVLVNRPDSFGLSAVGPNGQKGSASAQANTHGQAGMVEFSVAINHTKADDGWGTGDWTYTVECGDCQDQYRQRFGVLGLISDTGNDWTLTITYTYYKEKSS